MRIHKQLCKEISTKGFSFLNQCFAQLRFWKSVSDSRNLLAGATAVLLETLFQNRSCAKHRYKKLKPLECWFENKSIIGINNCNLISYCNLEQLSVQYPYCVHSSTPHSGYVSLFHHPILCKDGVLLILIGVRTHG